MTDTIDLPRGTVLDLIAPEEGDPISSVTVVSDSDPDDDDLCDLVIRDDDGNLWLTTYTSHPEVPLFHDVTTVKFSRVVARQKVVTEYVKPSEIKADASSPREMAIRLMLDAARRPDWSDIWDETAKHYPDDMPDADRERLVKQVRTFAKHADIAIAFPADATEGDAR